MVRLIDPTVLESYHSPVKYYQIGKNKTIANKAHENLEQSITKFIPILYFLVKYYQIHGRYTIPRYKSIPKFLSVQI